MKLITAAALGWVIGWLGPPLWALSVRTPSKEITLDDLRIGHAYSLAQKARDPAISNTGDEPIRVRMETLRPKVSELVDGYEPIPSLSWIKTNASWKTLKPGDNAVLSGELRIPKSGKWHGGQYQVEWLGEAENLKGARLNFSSHLLLDVANDEPEYASAVPKANVKANLAFALSPPEAHARDVPLGQAWNLRNANGITLKLINPNDSKATFVLRVERGKPKGLRTRPGFTAAPNPYFLRIQDPLKTVKAGAIGIEKLILDIPDESRYRDRNWFFVVSTRLAEDREQKIRTWVLYVSTIQTELQRHQKREAKK